MCVKFDKHTLSGKTSLANSGDKFKTLDNKTTL